MVAQEITSVFSTITSAVVVKVEDSHVVQMVLGGSGGGTGGGGGQPGGAGNTPPKSISRK